jgi:hypothetical protein
LAERDLSSQVQQHTSARLPLKLDDESRTHVTNQQRHDYFVLPGASNNGSPLRAKFQEERDQETLNAWQKPFDAWFVHQDQPEFVGDHFRELQASGANSEEQILAEISPVLTSSCIDVLASNVGLSAPCTYDCGVLKAHYFPGHEASAVCFLHQHLYGWTPELLNMGNDTIQIPTQRESRWIIQGQIQANGLPVELPARISSGSVLQYSEASIVIRHVRFSGRIAPIDAEFQERDPAQKVWLVHPYISNGEARFGGAFLYEGGGSDPSHTPKLLIDNVIFDHNEAIVGGGMFTIGRWNQFSAINVEVRPEICMPLESFYIALRWRPHEADISLGRIDPELTFLRKRCSFERRRD